MKQKYEVMAILSNELAEKDLHKAVETHITNKLKEYGSDIQFEDIWGARGFAYRIKNQSWGYYVVIQFTASSESIDNIEKEWNIDTRILRYLISKVNTNDPAPKTYKELQVIVEETTKKKELESNKEQQDATKVSEEGAKKSKKIPAGSKDDVDKKLDAIIEDSSINL